MIKDIVIVPDSFKGSATSIEVAQQLKDGLLMANNDFNISTIPIADGGEGTVEAVTQACDGEIKHTKVIGPSGDLIDAKYGVINNTTSVIEVAETSGLSSINQDHHDPYCANTFGLGQLIKKIIIEDKKSRIIIGLGGSATNDVGLGMLEAMGAVLTYGNGEAYDQNITNIDKIEKIDLTKVKDLLVDVELIILSDVKNPLLGKNGATYIFGPQKGIDDSMVEVIDSKIANFIYGISDMYRVTDFEGAGAAGGLGFTLVKLCGGTIYSGIDEVMKIIDLDSYIRNADLVITGEGKFDNQSKNGKAPVGIARNAKKYNVPVIAVVGSFIGDVEDLYNGDIDLFVDIINKPMDLDEAMNNSYVLIKNAGFQIGKMIEVFDH